MQWKSPPEWVIMTLLSPILVPLAAFLVVGLAPMALWEKYGPRPKPAEWRPWFAWYPVKVKEEWDGRSFRGTWAWLCKVEHKRGRGYRLATLDAEP